MNQIYETFYGGRDIVRNSMSRILWAEGPCRMERWMEGSSDFFVVANLYNCAVIYYSLGKNNLLYPCTKFLPWNSSPNVTGPYGELVIVHLGVGFPHYITIFLTPEFPIPPIHFKWYDIRMPNVIGWEDRYEQRIGPWNTFIGV